MIHFTELLFLLKISDCGWSKPWLQRCNPLCQWPLTMLSFLCFSRLLSCQMGPCCMMTMTFLRETTLGKWPDEEVTSPVWYCIHQLLTTLMWSHEWLVDIKDDLWCGWDVTNRHHYSCKQQCQAKEYVLIRNWFYHNGCGYLRLQPNRIHSAYDITHCIKSPFPSVNKAQLGKKPDWEVETFF